MFNFNLKDAPGLKLRRIRYIQADTAYEYGTCLSYLEGISHGGEAEDEEDEPTSRIQFELVLVVFRQRSNGRRFLHHFNVSFCLLISS